MLQDVIDRLMDFGLWGIFIHSFIDAVIFPIPAFFLQVSLSILNPSIAIWIATVGYIGCLLGTPFGYLIGRLFGKTVLQRMLKPKWIDKASGMFDRNGEAAILIGAFTPIPFKVFTILAGSLQFSLWKLIGYASIGRAAKFYIVGILFYWYGRAAEDMVYSYLTSIMLGLAAVIAIGIYIKRSVQRKKEQTKLQSSVNKGSHS